MQTEQRTEQLLTLTAIADVLGVPPFKMRRAAKSGLFPVYRIGNKRALARLTEVVAAVEAASKGGAQ